MKEDHDMKLDVAARSRHHVHFIESFTTFAVSVTVLTTVSFLVIKLCQKLSQCCAKLFSKKATKDSDNVPRKYQPLRAGKPPPLAPTAAVTRRLSQQAVPFSPLYTAAEFQIPGMVACSPVQPGLYEDSCSASSSEDVTKSLSFVEEYIQPDNLETRSLGRGRQKAYLSNEGHGRYSSAFELREDQLMPELYSSNVDLVESSCSLGKVAFTLQYEDSSKRRLVMVMSQLTNLRFNKGPEMLNSFFLSVILLPEREYVYKTKTLQASPDVKLHDKFSFHSRPRNRDFESRTIVINVVFIGASGKEVPFGEARLPLLSHGIYSQFTTDVAVGIKPITQNEIGDAQIQLNYSAAHHQLTVMCMVIHLSNVATFDKLAGVNIKAHLIVPGEKEKKKESKTKKKSVSKTIRFNEARYIEFQDPMTFSLSPEHAADCLIKISIHGRHKTLAKKMCLGKIRIGSSSPDMCGQKHWKHVLSSREIAWVMWHPIYNN